MEGRFDWRQIVGVRHIILFFRVNFMDCCRLVSPSAVGLGGKWNGRIVFSDVMQSERGLFAMFVCDKKKWSKKREDFCIESSMF